MSTRTFRYDTTGRWFKGNTHIHSTNSDGGMNPADIAELYAGAGYNFLFATDHMVASAYGDGGGPGPLLWVDGIEVHGEDETGTFYHVVCLGPVTGVNAETPLPEALATAREQGALTILAHPMWCGNSDDDARRHDFNGVEIYNHVCHWLNGKSGGLAHWHAMLATAADTLGFAVDDAHLRSEHPGWNGAWICVNAPECSGTAILTAIRQGNFYSSQGPEFRSIERDGDTVRVTTSPIQFARLVGPMYYGDRRGGFPPAEPLAGAEFEIPADWAWMYLEIEDAAGHRAWTNPLFVAKD